MILFSLGDTLASTAGKGNNNRRGRNRRGNNHGRRNYSFDSSGFH